MLAANGTLDAVKGGYLLRGQVDDASLQCESNGVGAILGAELREYVSNVSLGGFFADGELCRDLLVRITGCNEGQDPDLALRKHVVVRAERDLFGNVRIDAFCPTMYEADGLEQILANASLENVRLGAGLQSPLRESVPLIGG